MSAFHTLDGVIEDLLKEIVCIISTLAMPSVSVPADLNRGLLDLMKRVLMVRGLLVDFTGSGELQDTVLRELNNVKLHLQIREMNTVDPWITLSLRNLDNLNINIRAGRLALLTMLQSHIKLEAHWYDRFAEMDRASVQYMECHASLHEDMSVAPENSQEQPQPQILTESLVDLLSLEDLPLKMCKTAEAQDILPIPSGKLANYHPSMGLLRRIAGLKSPAGPLRILGIIGAGGIGKTTLLFRIMMRAGLGQSEQVVYGELPGKEPNTEALMCVQASMLLQLGGVGLLPISSLGAGRRALGTMLRRVAPAKKALFIAIDNVWRAQDMKRLLPKRMAAQLAPTSSCIITITSREHRMVDALRKIVSGGGELVPAFTYKVERLVPAAARLLIVAQVLQLQGRRQYIINKCVGKGAAQVQSGAEPRTSEITALDAYTEQVIKIATEQEEIIYLLTGGIPLSLKTLGSALALHPHIFMNFFTIEAPQLQHVILGSGYRLLKRSLQTTNLDLLIQAGDQSWKVHYSIPLAEVLSNLQSISLQLNIKLRELPELKSYFKSVWCSPVSDEEEPKALDREEYRVLGRPQWAALPSYSFAKLTLHHHEDVDLEDGLEVVDDESDCIKRQSAKSCASTNLLTMNHLETTAKPNIKLVELPELKSFKSVWRSPISDEEELDKEEYQWMQRVVARPQWETALPSHSFAKLTCLEVVDDESDCIKRQRAKSCASANLPPEITESQKDVDIEEDSFPGSPSKAASDNNYRITQQLEEGEIGCKHEVACPQILDQCVQIKQKLHSHCVHREKLKWENCECHDLNWLRLEELHNLQKLTLKYCWRLRRVPLGIFELQSLRVLKLHGCSDLQELPMEMGRLTALETLDVRTCQRLKRLPESLCTMVSLVELSLCACATLDVLPDNIGKLSGLKTLRLTSCKNLFSLPDSTSRLVSLVQLDLQGCGMLKELPRRMGYLYDFSTLNFLNEFLSSWRRSHELELKILTMDDCSDLTKLPPKLSNFKKLRILSFANCQSLKTLGKSVCNLDSLVLLSLEGCLALQKLPKKFGIHLRALELLHLMECRSLRKLPSSICRLEVLTELDMTGCVKLEWLPWHFGSLNALRKLKLANCQSLRKLPESICKLHALVVMDLHGCDKLEEPPVDFGKLGNLEMLDLHNCGRFKSFPHINALCGDLQSLRELDLRSSQLELKWAEKGDLYFLGSDRVRNFFTLWSGWAEEDL